MKKLMEFRDKYITGVSRVLKEFKTFGAEIKEIKALKAQIELLDKRLQNIQSSLTNMEMARTLEFLSQKQTLPKTSNFSHYILFEYRDHIRSGFRNLGDYVQTFAVKKALDKIEQNFTYEFFDRDNFSFYNGGALQLCKLFLQGKNPSYLTQVF